MKLNVRLALWLVLAAAGVLQPDAHGAPASPTVALASRWYRNLYAISNQYWACSSAGMAAATNLAAQAAQHGYTGVEVPVHYFFEGWTPACSNNFRSFVSFCSGLGLEVIPEWFAFNGWGTIFDRNFAEADPISDLPLLAKNNALWPAPSLTNLMTNGSFELHTGDTFPGYLFIDKPGIVSFADSNAYDGSTSVRMENFSANSGMGRICQDLNLRTNFQYRLRFAVRKESCSTPVAVQVYGKLYNNTIQFYSVTSGAPDLPWTSYECEFTTGEYAAIRVYLGIWGGSAGRIWVDKIEVLEAPSISNIVRRDGTPLSIKSMDRLTTYNETNDFNVVSNTASLASIGLPPGSRLTNGQTVLLSCYRIAYYDGYSALCMSHEPVYTRLLKQTQAIHDLLPAKKFFMYIDEIRCMASCKACRDRSLPTSRILGDCVTRLCNMIHAIDPSVQIYTWGDMLDPNCNAINHYYKVHGDLTGSWNYIPKDIVMLPWGSCATASAKLTASNSLTHFMTNGFAVMAGGYYDSHNLVGTTNWIDLLLGFTNASGLIYTSWVDPPDFSMLAPFGDLMMSTIAPYLSINGIPAWWLIQYFGSTNAVGGGAGDDPDQDGMNNLSEYLAGTNPTNRNSVLRMSNYVDAAGSKVIVTWPSASNKYYSLLWTTNLNLPWTKRVTNIPATIPLNAYTDTVNGVKGAFYRAKVE